MNPARLLLLLAAAATLASGCAGTADSRGAGATASGDDVCRDALAHVNACAGTALTAPASCDPDAAHALLGLSCAALRAPAGARAADVHADSLGDVLRGIACDAGILRSCDAPACTAPKYPAVSTVCSDYIAIPDCGGCQFYACREAEHACGASGYYLGYAQKYCERFLAVLRARMSPAGQQFLDAGRDCLMRYVDSQIAVTDECSDVKERAFASHVACYHDNGFCQLPLSDRVLLINTVDPADVDFTAALKTALSCL
jgi:hypothetical protein